LIGSQGPKLDENSSSPIGWKSQMLQYAVVFFVIAIIAALFGFSGIATDATEIGKILFFVFVILTAIALITHAIRGK
jgi:uncharacterized membrane protein YtjA (UPF0391 family)